MSDLDDLKKLLFGAEKEVLESIQQRVQLPEARAADIAAVLPEAIHLRHRENDELVESLRDPVGRCVRDSIRDAPEEFGDALYPVMGPAIRKSISHALKAFAEQINRTLEHSLTLRGLKWRVQAARAGVPFASYVIQQSLLYRVEQAYLISRENGLLIGHVHHDASRIKDSDAVSAMFTAIQDFVKESFSPDRTGRLETADMGDFTLWAVHGPHALLVCVIRGVPPRALRNDLTRVLERLHFRFGDALRNYAGDTTSVTGIEEELERCLLFEAVQPRSSEKKKINWPVIFVSLLILGGIGWLGWLAWQQSQQQARLQSALDDTPGIYIAEISESEGQYTVRGLRDPLAAELTDIAARAGLQPEQLHGELRPYRSLDESIMMQRALQQLAPEPETRIELVDGALLISGPVSQNWLNITQQKAAVLDLGWPVKFGDIEFEKLPILLDQAASLDGAIFYFALNVELAEDSAAELAAFSNAVSSLATEAESIGAAVNLGITGFTDSSGVPEFNEMLARQRAAVISAALREAGVAESSIAVATFIEPGGDTDSNLEMRRATVAVSLTPPGE